MNRLLYIKRNTIIWCVCGFLSVVGILTIGRLFAKEVAHQKQVAAEIANRRTELAGLASVVNPKKALLEFWKKDCAEGMGKLKDWVESRREQGDLDITDVSGGSKGKMTLKLNARSAALACLFEEMRTNHPALFVSRISIRREGNLKVELDISTIEEKKKGAKS